MNDLKIYNTLTCDKQFYVPIIPGTARIYVCGVTVYDYCHLGHARLMVVFDIVQRWLRASGLTVTYVRNITDIDDKIIQRAIINKESISQLTHRFITAMHEDAAALGVQKPDYEPRATAYIPKMLSLIKKLQHYGLAYKGNDGDIYFSVKNFPKYGKLSKKILNDLLVNKNIIHKHNPFDFVLWKTTKSHEPNDAQWNSPWGIGRPGWHIECSAMSIDILGKHFDIHGGGQDLQFPHHENEIAQSEGAYRNSFVNYWMHNGFVQMNNEKMTKSLGNVFTIRDLLKKYDPEVIRFFILRAHYRSPLNYSDANLKEARQALIRLYTVLKKEKINNNLSYILQKNEVFFQRFSKAMNDDFNTPVAIAVLFDLAKEINKSKSIMHIHQLKALASIIGLLQQKPDDFLKKQIINIHTLDNKFYLSEEDIEKKILIRNIAKKYKNFTQADKIRAELNVAGIILEDKVNGLTEWYRK